MRALIGVRRNGNKVQYVKRSAKMTYPNLWTLFSIQYQFDFNKNDRTQAAAIFQHMSDVRLGGAPVFVGKFLCEGTDYNQDLGEDVSLRLYEIDFPDNPNLLALNPDYYSETRWMTVDEHVKHIEGNICGLCLKLWQDYAYTQGLCSQPYSTGVTKL